MSRGPALVAALLSGIVWDFLFIPPRFALPVITLEDGLILGSYFLVALTAGQLTTRLRASELRERQRTEHATDLLQVTRTLANADSLDTALQGALRLGDQLLKGQTALLLATEGEPQTFNPYPGSTLDLQPEEILAIRSSLMGQSAPSPEVRSCSRPNAIYVPLLGAETLLGAFAVEFTGAAAGTLTDDQRNLIQSFASQISLVIEREHLREARERERILAESDRLRHTLLNSVSHEMKTPLAVLRSGAECLKNDDPTQRGALVQEILEATRRLDRLVANLLNQARLEAGAIHPQLDWCDARDLVATARRSLAYALVDRAVTMEIAPDLPLIKVDAPLMEHALENLLINACLHTPPSTPLELCLGADQARRIVFISIADHGPGIPANLRGSLFQKFRRGSSTGTGGVGLGLSIVRGLVEAQGGEVVAEDNPGGGAKFTIFLPLLLPQTAPEE